MISYLGTDFQGPEHQHQIVQSWFLLQENEQLEEGKNRYLSSKGCLFLVIVALYSQGDTMRMKILSTGSG